MSNFPEPEGRNPYIRAGSLTELLAWDDLDFVRCAYVTVLGRQPDRPGQTHYVEQIRAGFSKLDVLWRLRRSPEAKVHDPGIAGLDRALKRAAWERRALLGVVARFVRVEADRDSHRDRTMRALLNAASRNQRALEAIRERLTGLPATSGPGAAMPAAATDLLEAGQALLLGEGAARGLPRRTPELDHLRKEATSGRFIGGVGP